jgi:prevent-host-death family protein
MRTVKSRYLRDHLKEILAAVEAGEEIIIEQYKTPVAKLVPIRDGERTHEPK